MKKAFVLQTALLPLAEYHGEPCPYCHKPMLIGTLHRPTRDHALPRSKGGTLTLGNRHIICHPCNSEKSDMMPDQFRVYMRKVEGIPLYETKLRRKVWLDVKLGRET